MSDTNTDTHDYAALLALVAHYRVSEEIVAKLRRVAENARTDKDRESCLRIADRLQHEIHLADGTYRDEADL